METQLNNELDTSKAEMLLYPTPEQQRDIIKKIENDKTVYSYFVCKAWYHQWKAHVNYHELGADLLLDDIVTQQPIGTEKEVLKRRATCRGPGLAIAAQKELEANDDSDDNTEKNAETSQKEDDENEENKLTNHKETCTGTANNITESVNSTNELSNWENTEEDGPILASSTPIKCPDESKVSGTSLLRKKPKLTRVCRNSSKTEIDSSFESSEEVSGLTAGLKPINPALAGLRSEGTRDGEKPNANASISEKFQQAKDRQVKLNSDQSNCSGDSESPAELQADGEGARQDSVDKHVTFSMKPGPLERDSEENNILVNENVWQKLVQWYGISESHDLGRAFTNADKNCFEDFGISLLSPVMTFIERPVRSLNIRDEVGYIELQVRKMLNVPAHKSTRLWIREKDAKSKLKTMLDRSKALGVYQEELKCDLSCILALEIMDLEGMWPSGYPGNPEGRFDKYLCLVGHQSAVLSWEQQLEGAICDVLTKMPTNQKALISAITMTTKHILETTIVDMEKAKEQLETKTSEFHMMAESIKCKLVTVQQKDKQLTASLEGLKVKEDELKVKEQKFEADIASMKEVNKIVENQVTLDVGGTKFITSTTTLTSDPESLLGTMFSGVHPIRKEEDGSYFIDRDGTHFRYVLNFLRDGTVGCVEPTNQNTLLELFAEAEYYKIQGLITAVRDLMVAEGFDVDSEHGSIPERTPSKIPLRRLYEKGQSISSDPIL